MHFADMPLVEIVNLHSPALEFEAIHRIVTDVDTKALMSEMTAALELSEEKSEQAIGCLRQRRGKDSLYT